MAILISGFHLITGGVAAWLTNAPIILGCPFGGIIFGLFLWWTSEDRYRYLSKVAAWADKPSKNFAEK